MYKNCKCIWQEDLLSSSLLSFLLLHLILFPLPPTHPAWEQAAARMGQLLSIPSSHPWWEEAVPALGSQRPMVQAGGLVPAGTPPPHCGWRSREETVWMGEGACLAVYSLVWGFSTKTRACWCFGKSWEVHSSDCVLGGDPEEWEAGQWAGARSCGLCYLLAWRVLLLPALAANVCRSLTAATVNRSIFV